MQQRNLFKCQDCERGLHVFPSSKSKFAPTDPACIYCGAQVVDWDRTRRHNPRDIDATISELQKSKERYERWMAEIDIKAKNHALRKGETELRRYVKKRLNQLVGRVFDLAQGVRKPYRDGYQTPFSGNIVYYAQHATGCCCRPCIQRWHGIPQGRDLTENELEYLTELIMSYVRVKIPELQKDGMKIPVIRVQLRKGTRKKTNYVNRKV